jgi:hypothetical protein
MPPLASLVRGHKNPFQKEDVLTAGMYCFQYPTLGFKTVSEQYGTLRWKTSNCVDLSKAVPEAVGRHSKKSLLGSADERYCSDRRLEHGILCSVLERRSRLMTRQRPNWHELAEQASKELDPVRLMSLVDELNRALEQNEHTSMRLQTQKFV